MATMGFVVPPTAVPLPKVSTPGAVIPFVPSITTAII
jgi:hypothetical protein